MNKLLIIFSIFLIVNACSEPYPAKKCQMDISPLLFGQNLRLSNDGDKKEGSYDNYLWTKIEESGVKLIRIGGNRLDKTIPGNDTLLHWIKLIKEMGAEPLMQISKYKSANEAAELVRFLNIENNLKIKYWSIGNNPNHCNDLNVEEISAYIKNYSSAMKVIDPTIKILVPDAATYFPKLYEKLLLDNKLSVAGRDEYGNWYMDGITFHQYPNGNEYTRSDVIFNSISKMRGMILKAKNDIELANKKYGREGNDRLIWGLTEFNVTDKNPDYIGIDGVAAPSFLNGQFWIEVYGLCMEYEAFTATPSCTDESCSDIIALGIKGGIQEFQVPPTYYHLQMMAQNVSGHYVKMKTNNPFIKVLGSKSSKTSTIILMNQDASKAFNFDLSQINNPENQEPIGITSSEKIKAFYKGKIEPNTTLLFVLNKKGTVKKMVKYNLEMALKQIPPEISVFK
jgi:hypothetical protein